MKISGCGIEGFERILYDAQFYFSDKEHSNLDSINKFVKRYDVTDTRKRNLEYMFTLVIAELHSANQKGYKAYGEPEVVNTFVLELLQRMTNTLLAE